MTGLPNPYDVSRPGHLFVGYENERKTVLQGLEEARSYAILGSSRCGRTSLLFTLRDTLQKQGLSRRHAVPRFIDIEQETPRSTADFFRILYERLTAGIRAPRWKEREAEQPYTEFLHQFEKALPALQKSLPPNWLFVLLIDKLDLLKGLTGSEDCFHNLRSLLSNSPYRSSFCMVATIGQAYLTASGSPLVNVLNRSIPTRVLSQAEARQLIQAGHPSGLAPDVEETLSLLSGRHPYILHFLLELLGNPAEPPTSAQVQAAGREFTRTHVELFKRWHKALGPDGRAVFQSLAQSGDGACSIEALRQKLQGRASVSEGTQVLAYHGLIDEQSPNLPRIAGTLFRDWFLENAHMDTAAPSRNQVFVCYSRKDKKWLERLETHLKPRVRTGKVDLWSDNRIKAGENWREQIKQALDQARVAVLLVSPDFLASDFIDQHELPSLLEAADKRELTILWVPVSTSAIEETKLAQYQSALEDTQRPLDRRHHSHVKDALEEVCKKIGEALTRER